VLVAGLLLLVYVGTEASGKLGVQCPRQPRDTRVGCRLQRQCLLARADNWTLEHGAHGGIPGAVRTVDLSAADKWTDNLVVATRSDVEPAVDRFCPCRYLPSDDLVDAATRTCHCTSGDWLYD